METKDEDRVDWLSSRKKREGKIQYKHSHSEHYGFMSFWNPGKCLDSVCPCSVDGTDMKYSSVGGEAWLETFHLPTLNYPQLLLNWKIKQDPGFSFLILIFFSFYYIFDNCTDIVVFHQQIYLVEKQRKNTITLNPFSGPKKKDLVGEKK